VVGERTSFHRLISLVRCTLTVNSVIPMSLAICLFNRPVATWIMISRSGTLVSRKLGQFLCGKLDFSGSCSGVTGFERFELMWLPDSYLISSPGWCTPGCSGQRACLVRLSLALRFWRNAPSLPKISSLPAICFPIYSSKSRHQLSGRFDRRATPVRAHTEQQYWLLHERSHAHPRQSLPARATAASKVTGLLGGQLEVYGRGGGVPMRRDGTRCCTKGQCYKISG
jgi:hypothetical protein